MSINFAAVHDGKPWRKHRIHQSLSAAVDGNDGARNLLRRIGRVAKMWQKYGNVQCVFVWEDGAKDGQVFRLKPNGSEAIESAIVEIDRILRYDKRKGCTPQEISECFAGNAFTEKVELLTPPLSNVSSSPVIWPNVYPDELPEGGTYVEGLAQQVLVNRYERSTSARNACIAHYKCVCQVCRVDFSKRYGPLGEGFIHVHHLVPISGRIQARSATPCY